MKVFEDMSWTSFGELCGKILEICDDSPEKNLNDIRRIWTVKNLKGLLTDVDQKMFSMPMVPWESREEMTLDMGWINSSNPELYIFRVYNKQFQNMGSFLCLRKITDTKPALHSRTYLVKTKAPIYEKLVEMISGAQNSKSFLGHFMLPVTLMRFIYSYNPSDHTEDDTVKLNLFIGDNGKRNWIEVKFDSMKEAQLYHIPEVFEPFIDKEVTSIQAEYPGMYWHSTRVNPFPQIL